MAPVGGHPRLRAPQGDRQVLCVPPAAELPALWQANQLLLSQAVGEVAAGADALQTSDAGVPGDSELRSLLAQRRAAQGELTALAAQYTRRYRDHSLPDAPATGLLLAGHQPQLFHPGVLYKNFVMDWLARQIRAVPVNLVVDNDLCTTTAIAVPAGSRGQPYQQRVHFDAPGRRVPYEARGIEDRRFFLSFADRLESAVSPWLPQPLARRMWDACKRTLSPARRLGETLAAMRHRWEGEWGVETLELPVSRVCQTETFCRFAALLIERGRQVARAYNQVLMEFRAENRVRSAAHPVPPLDQIDDWVEVPFWLWHRDQPVRRRLFIRQSPGRLALGDRHNPPLETSPRRLAEQLSQWQQQGWAIRPRALTTTLYARLMLGDLFLHGIGGAKYDQLTDQLIARLWGIAPPRYAAVTATVKLPIEIPAVDRPDLTRIEVLLRQLRFHPEDHLPPSADGRAADLVSEKKRWIARQPPGTEARRRHQALTRINHQLQPYVEPLRRQLIAERDQVEQQLAEARILGSREYSFVLFPHQLGQWLRDMMIGQ